MLRKWDSSSLYGTSSGNSNNNNNNNSNSSNFLAGGIYHPHYQQLSSARRLPLHLEKGSYLVPPEGEDDADANATATDEPYDHDQLARQIKELAKQAAERLAAKNKSGKMGFLRRNSNGTTGFNYLPNGAANNNQPSAQTDDAAEKTLTIGNLSEGLQQSSYSMASFIEEKKNKTKPS